MCVYYIVRNNNLSMAEATWNPTYGKRGCPSAAVFIIWGTHFFEALTNAQTFIDWPLLWRHNGSDDFSDHQPHDCLLNRSFRRRSKKTSKIRVTGLCDPTLWSYFFNVNNGWHVIHCAIRWLCFAGFCHDHVIYYQSEKATKIWW